MRLILFLILNFSLFNYAHSQKNKSLQVEASRMEVEDVPKIDGKLEEWFWEKLPVAYNASFSQFLPLNGAPSSYNTEIKIGYTDFAVYVSARMYDPSPDSILTELGLRDDVGRNADLFGIYIDPYQNGQNAFSFIVSAAGVQTDLYITPRDWDRDWDAVWKSAVSKDERGWVAELEIPFSALRIPKVNEQVWGINFMRDVRRKREESYWNPVDNSVNGFVNQFGILTGIKDVKPPTRLFFLPYITAITNHDGLNNKKTSQISGGMDLKYGLNESYTLDLSLIPDFSQVQSDNVVLNLSPFEVQFNENRPFFTEGTELFNRGGIFYSRRVGQSFGIIRGAVNENERIVEKPSTAPMLNAMKISGRNSKGLGVGFFNAVTNKTFATVENKETGERRTVEADPITNFNVLVVDKNFKNNSHFSVINSNVTRTHGEDDANVTATDFRIVDKKNKYAFGGFAGLSQRFLKDEEGSADINRGYRYSVNVSKISGKHRFSAGRMVMSENYNINDLGYLARANEISHYANVGYHVFKPSGVLNRSNYNVGFHHAMLYNPNVLTFWNLRSNASFQLKNFWNFNINLNTTPAKNYDYFEPRQTGRVFIKPPSYSTGLWMNTDTRKVFYMSAGAHINLRPEWNQQYRSFGISPTVRVNDKLSFNYNADISTSDNSIGYVTKLYNDQNNLDNIVFGLREIQTLTNTMGGRFIFNNRMGVNMRVRHYWSKVHYNKFYDLTNEGRLQDISYNGLGDDSSPLHDKNFNAFNIDLVYSWQIAPGSFMNIVWKDAIFTDTNDVSPGFMDNLGNTMAAPQFNSISFKLLYFIDYLSIKKKFKGSPSKSKQNEILAGDSYRGYNFNL